METIWKYKLKITDKQVIELPERAKILTAQIQNGELQLWAMVNPELPKEPRYIQIYGTGHDIKTSLVLNYISTVQNNGFVWHIFEVTIT